MNSFGQIFRLTTAGESHGPALVGILDGVPPGIPLDPSDFVADMDRRKPGTSRFTTQRREDDQVVILSGVFNGVTTGASLAFMVQNTDQRSKDYSDIATKFRPGHADYTYHHKYAGTRDYRGGGRSSARETAIRVAAGVVAKKILAAYGVNIVGYVRQIGDVVANVDLTPAVVNGAYDWASVPPGLNVAQINSNDFFSPDAEAVGRFEELLRAVKKEHDSVGAAIEVCAFGLPVGLGEPVFNRLDADIAYAMMGINAVKGVEVGDGFQAVSKRGSEHRDLMTAQNVFETNHCGGVLGGLSTGTPVVVRVALKPTSSIMVPGSTLDIDGNQVEVVTRGRHDPCVGIRAVPIAEAMLALVLVDHLMMAQRYNVWKPELEPAQAVRSALAAQQAAQAEDK